MKFSQDTADFVQEPNLLTRVGAERVAAGKEVVDLVSALSGREGPLFPPERLREIYSRALQEAASYNPDPFGQEGARRAIAEFYQQRGLPTSAEQILLSAGSSLAYLYLFRLLAEPGEEILCPTPSYPLFEHLGRLAQVKLRDYPLRPLRQEPFWSLDPEDLENHISTKTRAIMLVSPHNPTGFVVPFHVLEKIAEVAHRHQVALIQDEVFSEFLWQRSSLPRVAQCQAPLIFTVNGISKMLALPALKLGWILIHGEPGCVREAKERLAFISDLFLPVHEPIQFALPEILAEGERQIHVLRDFAQAGLTLATASLRTCQGWSLCPPEAGFYLPLRAEDPHLDTDTVAVALLRESGILVHPGSFYEIQGGYLILSFFHDAKRLSQVLPRLKSFLDAVR